MQKPKFKPIITRIKLNPEQAVLACACYSAGRSWARARARTTPVACSGGTRRTAAYSTTATGASIS